MCMIVIMAVFNVFSVSLSTIINNFFVMQIMNMLMSTIALSHFMFHYYNLFCVAACCCSDLL